MLSSLDIKTKRDIYKKNYKVFFLFKDFFIILGYLFLKFNILLKTTLLKSHYHN